MFSGATKFGVLICGLSAIAVMGCEPGRFPDLPPPPAPPPPPPGEPLPDVPCDVARVLKTSCLGCHAVPRQLGAPLSFVDMDDFRRPALGDQQHSVADRISQRIQDQNRPMPPEPFKLDPGDRQLVVDWIANKMPMKDSGEVCQPVLPQQQIAPPPECQPSESSEIYL